MIIVEGTDLVGKTTFCKRLLENPYLVNEGYWHKHLSKPPRNFDNCRGYIDMAYMKSVQDRFHMSEIVYSCLDNRETSITPEKYRIVDAHLRMMGAVTVVIICADYSILCERHATRADEEMYSAEQVCQANDYFSSLCSSERFGQYKPDYDLVIKTGQGKPFPDQDDIDNVLRLYDSRLAQLADAIGV